MLTKDLVSQNSSAKEGGKVSRVVSVSLVDIDLKQNILWDVLVKGLGFYFPLPLYLKHFPAFLQGHLVLSFSSLTSVPSKSVTVSCFLFSQATQAGEEPCLITRLT